MSETKLEIGRAKPRLYHAPSSYFSTIARLALAEANLDHESVVLDIHVRRTQQSPAYVRLNPNMSVPTLVLSEHVLDDSREIVSFAMRGADVVGDSETEAWLDLHYAFPIEELTFGGFLARSALARAIIPRRLEAIRRRLLRLATSHPDLAALYEARAAVFAERVRTFDPQHAARLATTRRSEAVELLERLDRHLADGRQVIAAPVYGAADVAWTVFLARMVFTGSEHEIISRPALASYWSRMQQRPSFRTADVWTKMHPARLVRGVIFG